MYLRRMLLPAVILAASVVPAAAGKTIAPINQRFRSADTREVPDLRSHVIPMMGKLGCNGRACHGSFQGRGGFRLSLFGYDFKADHAAMTKGDKPRVNLAKPDESLIIRKPSSDLIHEGGQRYKKGSWEHHVFKRWIEGGAKGVSADHPDFQGLDITPKELLFSSKGQHVQLKVVAKWSDGTREDVTPICRYQSNDTQVCRIDATGRITSGEPGDTHVVVFYDAGVVPVPVIRPVSDRVGSNYPHIPTPTTVDKLVVAKLRKLGIVPSELSTDAEFLRRVSLDLTGTLPSAKEVKSFLADKSPTKRQKKIDQLLKSPAYVAWWTTKLCDFTGNNDDGLVNVTPARGQASSDWYKWIYKRVGNNTPYDKIVENIVLATSRNKGESYEEFCKSMSAIYHTDSKKSFADRDYMPYYWARRTFRQPNDRAIGFAYTFLGMRIQCAQCHKHPFDRWTKDDFTQFTGFFASTASGIRDRAEYQTMLKKLGIEGKRGNQARRELANLLKEGKTIPFQEVYVGRGRVRRGGGNNNAIRNLRKQIRTLQQKLAAAKKADKKPQVKALTQQIAKLTQRARAIARRGRGRGDRTYTAKLLGGDKIDLSKVKDPREPLMKWLRDPGHAMLSRAFVNRVWASYFNVGIVNPPDDLSLANPPSNKELLDHLTQGFIKHNYDMKWLHREILSSRTYQLSWRPNDTNKLDERNFSRAVPRRLPAEVAYDALQQATASDEKHASMRSDIEGRAISIPGAGRRNRSNRGAQYALTIFGRSIRASNCDCDRSQEPSLLQTVYLQNDRDMYVMLTRPRDGWLREVASELKVRPPSVVNGPNNRRRGRRGGNPKQIAQARKQVAAIAKRLQQARKTGKKPQVQQLTRQLQQARRRLAQLSRGRGNSQQPRGNASRGSGEKLASVDAESIVKRAYLRTLSRYPTDTELKKASAYIRDADATINGIRDVLWALLNTKEFIVNH
jgi:Protein of unknown function (DUF1549)/Protein of unknown function (DUF1553)